MEELKQRTQGVEGETPLGHYKEKKAAKPPV